MLRRLLVVASIALAAGCGDDPANPFNRFANARPPSADAVLVFVSGSWTDAPGAPRELLALNADGSKIEQLTACAQADPPCDFVQAAPSPDRNRLVAIRTTPGAAEGASTLYFMDLSRSVETVVFPNRQILSADYSPDASFLIYTGIAPQTSQEDLFFSQPNGQEEQNLTQSLVVRERNARIDPFSRTAIFERIDESGTSRIYLYASTPITSGPAAGPVLPGTPYLVGADADPVFSRDGLQVAFRRLTGTGNGGLGTWDLLTLIADGASTPTVIATGPVYRGAPDWGTGGILFVETDTATSQSQLVLVQPDGSGRTVLRTENASSRMGSPRWLAGS
jgi:Tol biopolymer transport system component